MCASQVNTEQRRSMQVLKKLFGICFHCLKYAILLTMSMTFQGRRKTIFYLAVLNILIFQTAH